MIVMILILKSRTQTLANKNFSFIKLPFYFDWNASLRVEITDEMITHKRNNIQAYNYREIVYLTIDFPFELMACNEWINGTRQFSAFESFMKKLK